MTLEDYKAIVSHFVDICNALFFVFTEDKAFIKISKNLFLDDLKLEKNRVLLFNEYENVILEIKKRVVDHKIVLFIEHELENEANVCFTRFLKLTYPSLYIIFLTSEIQSERVIYLYEKGIDNCITKPVSTETLVEKIAFTVEPPSKIRHLIEFGKKALFDGLYEDALEFSTKVLAIKSNSPAGLMLQGDALKALDRRAEALEAYQRASQGAKLFLEPLKKLAEFYREEGDVELQLKYLEELTRLSPLNLERKVVIGSLHARLGKFDTAEMLFTEAISMAHERAQTVIGEVRQKVIQACLEHAPVLAERYLREELGAQEALHTETVCKMVASLGLSLRRQGRWQEAVVEYQKGLDLEPDNARLLFEMAMSYLEGEDFKSSASTMDEYLDKQPDLEGLDEDQCLLVGSVYLKAGDKTSAVNALQRCLRYVPGEDLLQKLKS